MNSRINSSVLIVCALCIACIAACGTNEAASEPAPVPHESLDPMPRRVVSAEIPVARVCVLGYATEFKLALAQSVASELSSRNVEVVVDDMSRAAMHPAAGYDAVVVLSGIEALRALPQPSDYIKAQDYAENLVYVFPYTLFNRPYTRGIDRRRIDAITCASSFEEPGHLEAVTAEVIARVDEVISGRS